MLLLLPQLLLFQIELSLQRQRQSLVLRQLLLGRLPAGAAMVRVRGRGRRMCRRVVRPSGLLICLRLLVGVVRWRGLVVWLLLLLLLLRVDNALQPLPQLRAAAADALHGARRRLPDAVSQLAAPSPAQGTHTRTGAATGAARSRHAGAGAGRSGCWGRRGRRRSLALLPPRCLGILSLLHPAAPMRQPIS